MNKGCKLIFRHVDPKIKRCFESSFQSRLIKVLPRKAPSLLQQSSIAHLLSILTAYLTGELRGSCENNARNQSGRGRKDG